jgi:hypothetical protein
MLFQMLLGTLPWTGLAARTTEEKYRKIHKKKAETAIDDMCKGFPEQFGTYLRVCRALKFTERPDYRYLRGLFAAIRQQIDNRTGLVMRDHDFEWLIDEQMANDFEALVVHDFPQPDDIDKQDERTPDFIPRTLPSPASVPAMSLDEAYDVEEDVETPRGNMQGTSVVPMNCEPNTEKCRSSLVAFFPMAIDLMNQDEVDVID